MTKKKKKYNQPTLKPKVESIFNSIWAPVWDPEKPKILTWNQIKLMFLDNLPFLLVVIVFTIALYGNSLSGNFLIADDIPGLVQNPVITNFQSAVNTHKINIIFDSYLFQAGHGTPSIFHIRSVILHLINTILVFILASMIFNKKISITSSLLFLAHPINTEAVSWISAWIYLALTMFTLLVTIFFLLYRRTGQIKYVITSVVICAIYSIFFTDNWVFTIPIIVVFIDQLLVEKKINFKVIKNYIPLLTLGTIHAVYLLSTSLTERINNLKNLYYNDISKATPFLQRVPYTAFMTYKQYVFPRDLTIYHEGYVISPALYIIMIIFTVVLVTAIIYLLFKNRVYAALLSLPLISILPSFSPVPVAWLMADRYLYRGTMFFALLVVITIFLIEQRLHKSVIFNLAIIIILLALSVRTIVRNVDWKSDKNLWEATKIVSPYSARVYNNLGDVFFKEGNMPKAIEYFQIALKLKPDFADVVHNLGYTYLELGNYDLARQYLQKSYEMNPYLYQALYKLGYLEYKLGNYDKSEEYFKQTLQVNPTFDPAKKALEAIQMLKLQQFNNVKPIK
jgi:protein O-mannosyl-transferase